MRLRRVLSNSNVIEYEKMAARQLQFSVDGFHIRIVFNERQEVHVGNRKFSIFPDCLAIIPPGCKGEYLIDADVAVHALAITLTPNFMETFLAQQYFSTQQQIGQNMFDLADSTIIPMSSDMQKNFQHLWQKTVSSNTEDALLNEYISQFLLDYSNGYHKRLYLAQTKLPFARLSTKTDISKRLLLAKEYISNNYNQKFYISDIAHYCCLSENHLLRTFKMMFEITPYQYLALIRLNRAKGYLERSTYAINDIVIKVGFESVSTFIKLFRSTFKLTPLQYRKYIQNKLIG